MLNKRKSIVAVVAILLLILFILVILYINRPVDKEITPDAEKPLLETAEEENEKEEPVLVYYEQKQKEMLATSTFEWIQYETIENGYDMRIELLEDYFGKDAGIVDLDFGEIQKIGALECATVSVKGVENCNYTLAYLSSNKNLVYVSDNDENIKIVDHIKDKVRNYFIDGELYDAVDKEHDIMPGIIAKISEDGDNCYIVNVFSEDIEISKYKITTVPNFKIEEL